MKRAMRWNDSDDDESSSSSSHSDSEIDEDKIKTETKKHRSKVHKPSKVEGKSSAVDFEALKRYGYKGGLSVLNVPPPKEDVKPDWSWSTGKERAATRKVEEEESYEERQKTRYAVKEGEQLANAQTQKDREKKGLSFSQKEKRKRELGQASRGKNYVEEEKRLLRDNGIYSGFDA